MDNIENKELLTLIEQATAGNKDALETIILSVQDLVFNLSLRMLGTFPDAEDASQDILLKVITHLSSFKRDSSFSTWVFSIAINHLKNYKKHMFAKFPLSFEFYGDDILNGKIDDVPDLTQDVEKSILAEELKCPAPTSCSSVLMWKVGASLSWVRCSRWTAELREIFWVLPQKHTGRDCPGSERKWQTFCATTAANMERENVIVSTGSITPSKTIEFLRPIWTLPPPHLYPQKLCWK